MTTNIPTYFSEVSDPQVVNGKKQRGAFPTTKGNKGLYLLNVWVSENRLCIAQEKVEDKSNKIEYLKKMLRL